MAQWVFVFGLLLQTVLRCVGGALAKRQCKRAFDFPLAAAIAQLGAIGYLVAVLAANFVRTAATLDDNAPVTHCD